MDKQAMRDFAEHPIVIGVLGILVGVVAAYGAPTFANSVMRYVAVESGSPQPPGSSSEPGGGGGQPGNMPPQTGMGGGQMPQPPQGGGSGSGDRMQPAQEFRGPEGLMPQQGDNRAVPNNIIVVPGNRGDGAAVVPGGRTDGTEARPPERMPMPPNMPGRDQQKDGGQQNNNGNGMGQGGPSEEDMTKMQAEQEKRGAEEEARQEARQKADDARRLADMKRQMKQPEKELKKMKTNFAKFGKKGLTIPSECTEALSKVDSLVSGIKAATTIEALEELSPEDMQDNFDVLQDCMQNLDRLSRVPSILKRVDRDLKSLNIRWARARKSASDSAADAVADGESIFLAIKQSRSKLDELFKSGEVDDIEGIVEDDIYGRFDDMNSVIQRIDAVKNARQFMADFNRRMKEARALVTKLKHLKKDTASLEEILASIDKKNAEIKTLKAGTEEYQDAVNELAELGQDFYTEAEGADDFSKELGPSPDVKK